MPSTRRISDAVKKRKKDTKETTDHKNQPTGPSVYHFPIWQEGPPRIVCTTKCWAYVAVMSSDGCVWASGEPEQRRMNETNNTHNNTHTSSWTFPLYFCAFAKEKHASQGDAKKKVFHSHSFFYDRQLSVQEWTRSQASNPFFFFYTVVSPCLPVVSTFPFQSKRRRTRQSCLKATCGFWPGGSPSFLNFFLLFIFYIRKQHGYNSIVFIHASSDGQTDR